MDKLDLKDWFNNPNSMILTHSRLGLIHMTILITVLEEFDIILFLPIIKHLTNKQEFGIPSVW